MTLQRIASDRDAPLRGGSHRSPGVRAMAADNRAVGANGGTGRSLLGLLVAQSLGAFNDNAWKQIAVLLAIAAAGSEAAAQEQAAFAQVILMIPLMLVSLPAGVLAD